MPEFLENTDQVRRIPAEVDSDRLQNDLAALSAKAVETGAADVRIISSREVVFNPKIREGIAADEAFPSVHWPLDYPKDDIKEAVRAYESGILFCVAADDGLPAYGGGPIDNLRHREQYLLVYRIVSTIESMCFYMGYHLAAGFAAGNCRSVFCGDEKRCAPMLKGKPCIHPNKGRPSMEAAGIDPVAMIRNAGWDTGQSRSLLAGLLMVV